MLSTERKLGLSRLLFNYNPNDRVVIDIDPTQVKGMPHRRFNGLVGKVLEIGKRSLKIEVFVGNKRKIVIARKEHVFPWGVRNVA